MSKRGPEVLARMALPGFERAGFHTRTAHWGAEPARVGGAVYLNRGRKRRHMSWLAYPSWLNAGDNAWQMTAATFVGLMSLPGLAVLYGGVMQKRWAVNSMMLTFVAFSLVLVAWVLWGFKMGFGSPIGHGKGFFDTFWGKSGTVLSAGAEG